MKQLKETEQLIGKTIRDVRFLGRECFLIFEGEKGVVARSYCVLEIENGYESCDDSIELSSETPDDLELLQVGLISPEEARERGDKRIENRRKIAAAAEKELYERLKRKYS